MGSRGTPAMSSTVPYYADQGRATDYVLRCKDCQRLVTAARIQAHGCCRCGNSRFLEVRTLSRFEQLRIRVGLLRFPYWREFLAQFGGAR